MSRGPHTFKQSDLRRLWQAAHAAGLDIVRTEIHPDGRIILVHDKTDQASKLDPFDVWEAEFQRRSAEEG